MYNTKRIGTVGAAAIAGAGIVLGAGVVALKDKAPAAGKTDELLACPWCDPPPTFPGDPGSGCG